MPLHNYGVLRGRVVDHKLASASSPHFQLHAVAGETHYRVAVNVASKQRPSELEYLVDSDFHHPVLESLGALAAGFAELERKPGGAALDYIRGNLFDRTLLRKLPYDVPGPDNDLNEKLALYVRRAIADPAATVFAFGERWGPDKGQADPEFGFTPGLGVHDIHMNQANLAGFVDDDGVYQDGALLLHFPAAEQWVAIFLKFQSQTWHTDDTTGHQIGVGAGAGEVAADGRVRIVAALVDAADTPRSGVVTLLNTTAEPIALAGWRLADRDKQALALSGEIAAGAALRVALTPAVTLPDGGGVITLLDGAGLKVDGVAYTRAQLAGPGTTIVF